MFTAMELMLQLAALMLQPEEKHKLSRLFMLSKLIFILEEDISYQCKMLSTLLNIHSPMLHKKLENQLH
jgi:hypothetical protein